MNLSVTAYAREMTRLIPSKDTPVFSLFLALLSVEVINRALLVYLVALIARGTSKSVVPVLRLKSHHHLGENNRGWVFDVLLQCFVAPSGSKASSTPN